MMISVIVPVYKVEKYLTACVDSILAQSFSDFELILVDDGSPDACGQICDEYADADNRIQVIHKINGGLSDARNAGLDLARGEYVAFIDSDDYVHPKYLEYLLNGLTTHKADIAVCKILNVYEGEHPKDENTTGVFENLLDRYDALRHILLSTPEWLAECACGKLYRRSLFSSIRFPVGRLHEDTFTTYRVFYAAERIVFIDRKLYYYLSRNDSIMNSAFNIKRLDALDAGLQVVDFIEKNCDFMLSLSHFYLANICFSLINKMSLSNYRDPALLYKLKSYIFNSYHPFYNSKFTTKQKMWLLLLVSNRLYGICYRFRMRQLQTRRGNRHV